MGTYKLEMDGVCVKDWEDDRIVQVNPPVIRDAFVGGIARLVCEAGGGTVGDAIVPAFEFSDDPYWASLREGFQKATGLDVPTVMRLKITVEVENLSREESKALWDAHIAAYHRHRETAKETEEP